MEMKKSFPFEWDDSDFEDEYYYYYNTQFLEDFGQFSKGEKVRRLYVNYNDGFIASENQNGDIVKLQNYKLIPIE